MSAWHKALRSCAAQGGDTSPSQTRKSQNHQTSARISTATTSNMDHTNARNSNAEEVSGLDKRGMHPLATAGEKGTAQCRQKQPERRPYRHDHTRKRTQNEAMAQYTSGHGPRTRCGARKQSGDRSSKACSSESRDAFSVSVRNRREGMVKRSGEDSPRCARGRAPRRSARVHSPGRNRRYSFLELISIYSATPLFAAHCLRSAYRHWIPVEPVLSQIAPLFSLRGQSAHTQSESKPICQHWSSDDMPFAPMPTTAAPPRPRGRNCGCGQRPTHPLRARGGARPPATNTAAAWSAAAPTRRPLLQGVFK